MGCKVGDNNTSSAAIWQNNYSGKFSVEKVLKIIHKILCDLLLTVVKVSSTLINIMNIKLNTASRANLELAAFGSAHIWATACWTWWPTRGQSSTLSLKVCSIALDDCLLKWSKVIVMIYLQQNYSTLNHFRNGAVINTNHYYYYHYYYFYCFETSWRIVVDVRLILLLLISFKPMSQKCRNLHFKASN